MADDEAPGTGAPPGLDEAEGDGFARDGAAGKDGVPLKGRPDDLRTWRALAEGAVKESNPRQARKMFETLLRRLPLAERYWLQYCKAEFKAKNFARVEGILKRTLRTLESVNLWMFYLTYVMDRKLGEASEAAKNPGMEKVARKEVEEAFEYALKHIGFSFEAGTIWIEYIKFIESQKCDSQYDLGNRALAVRTAYARAVKVPVLNLEDLWKGFEDKERGNVSPEVQQEYMKAKAVYLERKSLLQGLSYGELPEPSSGSRNPALAKWKAVLEYEKSNPERVGDSALKKRVRHVYTKALSSLFFYPEMWYDFAQYEMHSNDPISSNSVLERSLLALPDSLMMHFAVADSLEQQGRLDKAREVYSKLEKKHPCPLLFIQFQHFERRVDGIAAARAVFRRARQSAACDSTVFATAANIEFHNNKDPRVARNVFELGLKRFPRDVGFIVQYMRFLEHLNEDTDLITLYERVLAQLDPRDAFPIWERYREFAARFVSDGGSIKSLASIEKRMEEVYPEHKATMTGFAGIAHRYAYLGQFPSLPADLAFFERHQGLSVGPHARMLAGMPVGGADSVEGATGVGGSHGNGFRQGAPPSSGLGGAARISGDVDSAKTPGILKKLDSLLPTSLGPGVRPLHTEFYLGQVANFDLPPKSLFTRKRRKQVKLDENDAEATDVFKKRKRAKA